MLEDEYSASAYQVKKHIDDKVNGTYYIRKHIENIESKIFHGIDRGDYEILIKDPIAILYALLTYNVDITDNDDFILFKDYILNRYRYKELYDSIHEIVTPLFFGLSKPSIYITTHVCLEVVKYTSSSEMLNHVMYRTNCADNERLVLELVPLLAENQTEELLGSESIYYLPDIREYMSNNEIYNNVLEDRESQIECLDELNMYEIAYSLMPNHICRYFYELTVDTIRYFKGSLPPSYQLFFKVFLRKAQLLHKKMYSKTFLLDSEELGDLEYTCRYIWFYAYDTGVIYDYYISLSIEVFTFEYFRDNLLNHIIINSTTLRSLKKGED